MLKDFKFVLIEKLEMGRFLGDSKAGVLSLLPFHCLWILIPTILSVLPYAPFYSHLPPQ